MSELALAAFASSTGEHLVAAPRSRRFESFVRSFDEKRFLADLQARGLIWLGRRDRGFPPRLKTIHDPPPGLFVRSESGPLPTEAPTLLRM